MYRRWLESLISDPDFSDRMIFISGPRQVGKTTLAQAWLNKKSPTGLYYNWDDERIRRIFRTDPVFFESEARNLGLGTRIVFDEIHKIPKWKNLLKGYFDVFKNDFCFLITGSARLEFFHRSGDSLLGRYHLAHLSPLIPFEVTNNIPNKWFFNPEKRVTSIKGSPEVAEAIETLMRFSGFPGVYIKQSMTALNLWKREYRQRMIREDLRDITRIADVSRVEHLMELLPHRVGAPLSLNALREEMNISHQSVRSLIFALEKLGVIFTLRPYYKKVSYSLKKEPKIYFYDWTITEDEGSKLENFMAMQLKAYVDTINDSGLGNMELGYLRDKQKREVDFILTKDKKPWLLVEVKNSFGPNDKISLGYFHSLLQPKLSICVVRKGDIYRKVNNEQWALSLERFMNLLWEC